MPSTGLLPAIFTKGEAMMRLAKSETELRGIGGNGEIARSGGVRPIGEILEDWLASYAPAANLPLPAKRVQSCAVAPAVGMQPGAALMSCVTTG